MGKSDQWVIITIVFFILLHLAVLVIGYYTSRVPYMAAWVNVAAAVFIIGYWVIRLIQIEQHTIEGRELAVLLAEVLVFSAATFYLTTGHRQAWLTIVQYLFFGIHLMALILGLIFMLTFKMNKLI